MGLNAKVITANKKAGPSISTGRPFNYLALRGRSGERFAMLDVEALHPRERIG
jgi:hypothetical protein